MTWPPLVMDEAGLAMGSAVAPTLVAGGFAVLAALIAGAFALRARRPPKPRVTIVDSSSSRPPGRTSVVEGALPPPTSTPLGVEVVEAEVPLPGYALDHPVVDVRFQNSGGRTTYLTKMELTVLWAKKFSVLEDLIPYRDTSGPLHIPPSAMYDVDLPPPPVEDRTVLTFGISQSIAAGDADRILIRARTAVAQSRFTPFSQPSETSVYLLKFSFFSGDRKETETREIGVASPGNQVYVPTILGLKRNIFRFEELTRQIRDRIDTRLREQGEEPPDWDGPRRPVETDFATDVLGSTRVNQDFWSPYSAILRYLDRAEASCRDFMSALRPDMPDRLDEARAAAEQTVTALPLLRSEILANGPFR